MLRLVRLMQHSPAFTDRRIADLAQELLARFGDDACGQAAMQADASRDRGNVGQFCRWRDVERLIVALEDQGGEQTRH